MGLARMLRCSRADQENHEAGFPAVSIPPEAPLGHTSLRTGNLRYEVSGPAERLATKTSTRSVTMKWETPAAAEIRFGFEITMYVANR